MLTLPALLSACLVAFIAVTDWADPPQRKPIDQLPSIKELPDPFVFNDGSRLKSPDDWTRRRKELVDLTLTYEYGALPPAIDNLKATVASLTPTTRPSEMPRAAEPHILLTMGAGATAKLHL